MVKNYKTLLVTGAAGYIGRKVCERFVGRYYVVAFDRKQVDIECPGGDLIFITGDISDRNLIQSICGQFAPDIIIHCAGIAHQSLNSALDESLYTRVNYIATDHLAEEAVKNNPEVYFIFLSTISVYGEKQDHQKVREDSECNPTSAYAKSKRRAEISLSSMVAKGQIKSLDVLRLAPVYSKHWLLNLEKRVFGPKKICYLKFGSGNQAMSVLARSNLVDFIEFRVMRNENNYSSNIFNVCDEIPYTFNQLINVFKQSTHQPDRIVIKIPLIIVWVVTRILGLLFKNKSEWIHSCYDKLANSLVFDNAKMMNQGFKPKGTLISKLLK